ncbi:MAG TPA: IMP cyclohydrolase [Candidatus Hydrogenedentes bacterium]|nr:IMP cyclohydrolase [Candidatus Hydrogenedentota bacterium]
MPKITRAILSCYDKTGIVELAEALTGFGVELITTEGTHRKLEAAGIESRRMVDFTGVREMLGGRVKTLHPKVHAGLLGIRDNKLHCEEMQTNEFEWIDMVVTNLHPIDDIIGDSVSSPEEVIEQLDIGGIAMVRSAAKNFRYVTVAVNPERYSTLIHELQAHDGSIPFKTRYKLAQEAFSATAKYDETLASFLLDSEPPEE